MGLRERAPSNRAKLSPLGMGNGITGICGSPAESWAIEVAIPPFLLHGTIGRAVEKITSDGLRFRRHEATFTLDLLTAALVYGVPANHPHAPEREDPNSGEGSVFIVATSGWTPMLSPTTFIWVDSCSAEIYGGISKWIGSYYTLYPQGESAPNTSEIQKSLRNGGLRNCERWKQERSETLKVQSSNLLGQIRVTPAVTSFLREFEPGRRNGLVDKTVLSAKLISTTGIPELRDVAIFARACRWIRRLALSILQHNGFRIMKADVHPFCNVEDKFLWPAQDLNERIEMIRRYGGLHQLPGFPDAILLLQRLQRITTLERVAAQEMLSELELLTGHGNLAQR